MSARAWVTSDTVTAWSARVRAKAGPQGHRMAIVLILAGQGADFYMLWG